MRAVEPVVVMRVSLPVLFVDVFFAATFLVVVFFAVVVAALARRALGGARPA